MKKLATAALAAVLMSPIATAADWGTITGQVVLDGDAPERVLLHAKGAPIKDAETCAANDTYKDDLVVDPSTKGIANVFVYLYKAPKSVHPDLKSPPPKVYFDQKNCVFTPHTLVVYAGQTVEVLNSDPIGHNTRTIPLKNQAVNLMISPMTGKGDGTDVPTVTREILPHEVRCDIHAWMKAYWLVVDHPYAASTDSEGKFTIKNLPAGDHDFRIWHERSGYIDRKYKVSVSPGENAPLEPISVKLEKFEE